VSAYYPHQLELELQLTLLVQLLHHLLKVLNP
jgi:hypothetical protein